MLDRCIIRRSADEAGRSHETSKVHLNLFESCVAAAGFTSNRLDVETMVLELLQSQKVFRIGQEVVGRLRLERYTTPFIEGKRGIKFFPPSWDVFLFIALKSQFFCLHNTISDLSLLSVFHLFLAGFLWVLQFRLIFQNNKALGRLAT